MNGPKAVPRIHLRSEKKKWKAVKWKGGGWEDETYGDPKKTGVGGKAVEKRET